MTCGAEKIDGGECGLPAGWGRETDDGPCRHHVDDGGGGSDRNDRQRGESARENGLSETSPGRADTFNDVAEKRILDALRDGATMELAARAAGISPRTLRRWRDRHETFNRKVQRAKAEAGADALDTINEAASDGDEWVPDNWDVLSPDELLDRPPSYEVERVEQLTEPIELAFVGEPNRGFLPPRAKPDHIHVGRLEEGLQLTEALEPIAVSDTPMLGNLTEAHRDIIAYLTDPSALPEAVDVDIDG